MGCVTTSAGWSTLPPTLPATSTTGFMAAIVHLGKRFKPCQSLPRIVLRIASSNAGDRIAAPVFDCFASAANILSVKPGCTDRSLIIVDSKTVFGGIVLRCCTAVGDVFALLHPPSADIRSTSKQQRSLR